MSMETKLGNNDLARHLKEETLLVHTSSLHNNTVEARAIVTVVLPDGTEYHANKIIKITLKKENL